MIRILLADDHQIVRQGLRALIEKEKNMMLVAEASNGREAIRAARETNPDVTVMDISMPDLNGIEATRQLNAKQPHLKVIALSMHCDKRFTSAMLQGGARGFLLKECAYDELTEAIRAVNKGKLYLCRKITEMLAHDYIHGIPAEQTSAIDLLTKRQREVLQLLAEGAGTRELAQRLCISSKTVETHRMEIMRRLGLFSIAQLTKYAVREGLTSPEPSP
ncbi:MAG: response regulator transcription factor [Spartobacteria bacterium]|nr:response regulator transcription factor [Spartobacteria bacterium]